MEINANKVREFRIGKRFRETAVVVVRFLSTHPVSMSVLLILQIVIYDNIIITCTKRVLPQT